MMVPWRVHGGLVVGSDVHALMDEKSVT